MAFKAKKHAEKKPADEKKLMVAEKTPLTKKKPGPRKKLFKICA